MRDTLKKRTGQGWLILVDEEADAGRRQALRQRGFEVEDVLAARGARLWRIRPKRGP